MNGRDIENLLSVIDGTINRERASLRGEIFTYLLEHEAEVLDSLRSSDKVMVPTSAGTVEIDLAHLRVLAA